MTGKIQGKNLDYLVMWEGNKMLLKGESFLQKDTRANRINGLTSNGPNDKKIKKQKNEKTMVTDYNL